MSTLNFGDLLLRPKCLGISHVGVWLGGGRVFHNAPARGEHVSSVEEFAQREPVTVKATNADPASVSVRVHSRLSVPRPYDVLSNNCEHTANHVVTGKAFSPQLAAGVAVLIALVLTYIAVRKR